MRRRAGQASTRDRTDRAVAPNREARGAVGNAHGVRTGYQILREAPVHRADAPFALPMTLNR